MATPDTVLDVLKTNCLQLSEFEKLKALVRWGRAQTLASADVEDGSNVRRKIEKCLNFIRFSELDHTEFAQLCRSDVHDVLSADEKSRIFESICLSDEELMPLQFRSANKRPTVNKLPLALALPYKEHGTLRLGSQNNAATFFNVPASASSFTGYFHFVYYFSFFV